MVGTEERQSTQIGRGGECWYSPGRVAYWLEHWAELLELAVPTAPAINYDKPSICVPEWVRPPNDGRYAEIKADIWSAWTFVSGWWFVAKEMGEWMMAKPMDIEAKDFMVEIAKKRLRVPLKTANRAWADVCEVLAIDLGWKRSLNVDEAIDKTV